MYSDATEKEETLRQQLLMPVRPFAATSLGPMKVRDSPRSDVSMCALIYVEDILSIPREL